MTVREDGMPDACTLPTAERPLRVSEFDDLLGHVLQSTRPEPTLLRLVLPRDVESAARDLAQRETECCSFFTFTFDVADDNLVVHAEVPPSQAAVLDAIERAQTSKSCRRVGHKHARSREREE
jgi:hypothetical protein